MENNLVLLKKFATQQEAEIVHGMLNDSDIAAVVGNEHSSFPNLDMSQGVRVLVPQDQYDQALELLNQKL